MNIQIQNDQNFVALMQKHLYETIKFLLENDTEFSILTNLEQVKFEPELPPEITANFKSMIIFALGGYTFYSSSVSSKELSFEAGFGSESQNISTFVTVPLSSIMQISVSDTPILINISIPSEKIISDKSDAEESMNALLSNPENQKFIK